MDWRKGLLLPTISLIQIVNSRSNAEDYLQDTSNPNYPENRKVSQWFPSRLHLTCLTV
jgi:hypothetical protein